MYLLFISTVLSTMDTAVNKVPTLMEFQDIKKK